MKRTFLICALTVLLTGALTITTAGNLPLPSSEATASITITDLRKHLSFLASDELGGRYTISPSSGIAARYLASQLESYGYKGAGPGGSFLQKVPLSYRSVDRDKSSLVMTINGVRHDFKYPQAFISQVPIDAEVSGELVFVGHGISSPANKHDDYAGLDVKGKIVLLTGGSPDSLRNAKFGPEEIEEGAAMAHGAAAAMVILPAPFMTQWEQITSFLGRETLGLPPVPGPGGKVLPTIAASPALISAIATAMGKEPSALLQYDGKRVRPGNTGASVSFKLAVEVKPASPVYNVVAALEGSDPRLRNEYVVFSAHYDHLKSTGSGEVYNGADDDGSGTVAVLEIAQAFSVGPRPPRSILIVFHTAEELGLYGSAYNTDYEPVVPVDKLVANLNIDMIGRSRAEGDRDPRNRNLTDKNSVYIIGSDKLSSELHKLNEETNQATTKLRFDYLYNDENHPERFYYRSDHYNYAKHGVPIIFYFTGVHKDYHQTTDDIDKIDFEKMERIGRMIFAVGWRVATLDHRLVVDKSPK
jgi:hypothetical protein